MINDWVIIERAGEVIPKVVEVIKNKRKINPVNYYYNDLSPEEYGKMLEISSQNNQSFD